MTPGLSAHPASYIVENLARYIVGSAFGKECSSASGALQRLSVSVPSAEEMSKHFATTAELRFKVGMRKLGLPSAEIAWLWKLIEAGILAERELKAQAGGAPTGPNTKFINQPFEKLAHDLRALNLLDPKDKLALWSGGIAISQYARGLGYYCLETTLAGEIFDDAKIYHDDTALWDLWDYMAKVFVDQMSGAEVHIFVRNFDRKSTLLKVEVPHLQALQRNLAMKWHAIVGESDDPRDLLAVTKDGELKPETPDRQYYFDSKLSAEVALRAYVMKIGSEVQNRRDWKTKYSPNELGLKR
jgi:hypothetical protein